ncbi:MAG: hypothetical protein JNM93_09680 [Bacteriovoracaceae bacterium]|nr:hypothetical protein [Bacteriovoracaceae bacterium]
MKGPKEKWLSVVEYSNFKKISVSSIRRYIKANRVKHKLENGKYYILCSNFVDETQIINEDLEIINDLEAENKKLRKQIQTLKEETHEMRMLIEIYEKQIGMRKNEENIPDLP